MSDSLVLILKAIQEAPAPITFSALQKRTRVNPAELQQVLSEEVAHQRIYRWPELRRLQRFWRRPADEVVREQTLALAAENALPASLLAKMVRKRLPGYPEKLIASAIQQLLREKQLCKYPSFGRERFLVGREDHPAGYAMAARIAIEAILTKLRAGGAGDAEVRLALTIAQAPLAVALADEILLAMRAIEPQPTTPVSVRELRAALPQAAKHTLDQAALQLRASQRVYLSPHDFPQSLSEADREMLIDGGDGGYYVAITARTG